MHHREAHSRYRLIDLRLRRKPHPVLDDLVNYVSEHLDKPVSRRSIQRDIEEMRYNQALNFVAPIVYEREEKIYKYKDPNYSINRLPVSIEELHGLEFAIGILDQFKHLPAIREFEEAIKKIGATVRLNKEERGDNDFIQLEKNFIVRGLEHVEHIIKGIVSKKVLRLSYQRFDRTVAKEHLVEPYLIKEYKNFWYLVGNDVTRPKPMILTFALDRITYLELSNQNFEHEKIDKKKFYNNIFGVTISDGIPEKVVLSFQPIQGKYIKTLPIHHTQKILKDSEKELRISLDVIANHELKMLILSYGSSVRVLKPEHLCIEIKDELKRSLASY